MFQHHKVVCGGLFLFVTATHAGCAGNSVKNLFSRNETDGYHTLEELESQDRKLAEAEDSSSDDETPSVAARLASWRPFGKPETQDEEASSVSDASDASGSRKSAAETSHSPRLLGLPFSGRETVEADPFLGSDPLLADRGVSPAEKNEADQKLAAVNRKTANGIKELSHESGEMSTDNGVEQAKHQADEETQDAQAVALGAKPKSKSVVTEEEDLAKRFEQHFLLNSVGTIARAETDVEAAGNKLGERVEASKSKVAAKQRDIASIADSQIDQIDQILAADSGPRTTRTSKRNKSSKATPGNSLAAFDQLMGTEGDVTEPDSASRVHAAARTVKKKLAIADVVVANAETLFGAAAARQQARVELGQGPAETVLHDPNISRTGPWSQASPDSQEFDWNEATQAESQSNPEYSQKDPFITFGGGDESHARTGGTRGDRPAFGAPRVMAGNVDAERGPFVPTAEARFKDGFASPAAAHRIVTANYGSSQSASAIRPIPTELSAADDTYLTAAPVAPVSNATSEQETAASGTRTGLVQSFSVRNWLLLIGGIIVIALLFVPGRAKPLAMNG